MATSQMVRCSVVFVSGALEGITYAKQMLRADFAKVGKTVTNPCGGGSGYRITEVHG